MIHIVKNKEPNSLKWYRQQIGASFKNLDATVKNELRNSLLDEQGHLCAYCMSRINGNNDVKIEHYQAQNENNELVYRNLFAVCMGNEGLPYDQQTCDSKKKNSTICINPLKSSDIESIYYENNGKIRSFNPDFDNDLNIVLNLNCKDGYLVPNRRTALKSLQNLLRKKLKQGQNRQALLLGLQKEYSERRAELKPYVGIMLYYINKQLSKGKY